MDAYYKQTLTRMWYFGFRFHAFWFFLAVIIEPRATFLSVTFFYFFGHFLGSPHAKMVRNNGGKKWLVVVFNRKYLDKKKQWQNCSLIPMFKGHSRPAQKCGKIENCRIFGVIRASF